MHTEFTKKKVLLTLAAVSSARCRHGRHKVSIPECNLTGRLEERSTITLLPVRLHSGLTQGLTHIYSQIKPRLLFGESFTLTSM